MKVQVEVTAKIIYYNFVLNRITAHLMTEFDEFYVSSLLGFVFIIGWQFEFVNECFLDSSR